jgi:hypothetical protein
MKKRASLSTLMVNNPPYRVLSHKEIADKQARENLAHYHQKIQSMIDFINQKMHFTFKPGKRKHFYFLKEILSILKEHNCIQLRFFEENPTEYIHNKVIELTTIKNEISLWIKSNYDFNDTMLEHMKLKKMSYLFQKKHESWYHHAFTLENIQHYLIHNHGYHL